MKKLSTLILLSFFATAASAQIFPDKKLHVSVVPIFSYSVGQLGEEIYYSVNSSKRISELEWERNIFLFGANADIKYRQFKWSIGAASSLFEQKSGDMRDSDWLNESDYSMKTTYSPSACRKPAFLALARPPFSLSTTHQETSLPFKNSLAREILLSLEPSLTQYTVISENVWTLKESKHFFKYSSML